ncbi:hypothetical protein ACTFIW_007680 [Dictyostelium discoideum]
MLLKKRDSWRVIHDYDQPNKIAVRYDHPFTPVESLLNQCKDPKLFSKFDMIMGYFQVLINPEQAKSFESKKSEMLKTEVDFLGFHIHKDVISPRAAKVRAISELPEPRNDKEAKATLGDKFKVIWFHSRKLTDTQKRYSIGDREFLSIIDSLKKFQH